MTDREAQAKRGAVPNGTTLFYALALCALLVLCSAQTYRPHGNEADILAVWVQEQTHVVTVIWRQTAAPDSTHEAGEIYETTYHLPISPNARCKIYIATRAYGGRPEVWPDECTFPGKIASN